MQSVLNCKFFFFFFATNQIPAQPINELYDDTYNCTTMWQCKVMHFLLRTALRYATHSSLTGGIPSPYNHLSQSTTSNMPAAACNVHLTISLLRNLNIYYIAKGEGKILTQTHTRACMHRDRARQRERERLKKTKTDTHTPHTHKHTKF